MTTAERAFNVALGLSVASWSFLGEWQAPPEARFTAVRVTISAINAVAALLILFRAPAIEEASFGALLAAVPAMIAGGVAVRFAPAENLWPRAASVAFAVGGVITIASLVSLGRSFAVLPARRAIVQRGVYRWIRHPAYAGELVLVGACGAARGDLVGVAIALGAVGATIARIRAEESTLAPSGEYAEYARRVRYRLVPGLY